MIQKQRDHIFLFLVVRNGSITSSAKSKNHVQRTFKRNWNDHWRTIVYVNNLPSYGIVINSQVVRVNNIALRTNPYKVSNIYIYRSVTITMIPSIEQSKTISDHILPSRIVRIPLPFPRVAQIDNIISIRRNPLPIPRHTSEWRCYDNYETIGQIDSLHPYPPPTTFPSSTSQ